ncbi:glycosyltransferase family 4 protein [Dokdonella sp.]|uniref:glycosyltransferase family 4 protein n=1 Tax=Dokdonella sp. TaxID=2291710 RepID=UPI0027B9B74D|nr:glycosyltransferase family 4 protein [Dokdonella sp.]
MAEARPRVLLITRNLPPLVGGMERLNWHMADELSKYAGVRVVGPVGSASMAPASVAVNEVPLKPLWKFLLCATWRAFRVARAWRPDVVLAGSGLTAPAAWLAARACGARTVAYVHGLDLAVRHPLYRSLWYPALRRMDRLIGNSAPTAALARTIGVAAARIGIVHPGVDLPTATSQPDDVSDAAVQAFREEHGFGNRRLLLSVGRLSSRKGLREFVTRALPRIVATCPDVMLVVVGDAPKDALHAQAQTPESIRAASAQAGVADHVVFLGAITDYAVLGVVYRSADVHVFPVRELAGDPEGFGMVAVEAAAHGLPTVAFATGGIIDAVAEGQSGHLVPVGDYEAFADRVVATLTEGHAPRAGCIAFARRFTWPQFGAQIDGQLAKIVPAWPVREESV